MMKTGKVAPKSGRQAAPSRPVRGWGGSYAKPELRGKKRGRPPSNAHPAWNF